MTKWNQLLKALDDTIGFPNKKSSRVIKRTEKFDNRTGEHVIWLEYRIRVSNEAQAASNEGHHGTDRGKSLLDALLGETV